MGQGATRSRSRGTADAQGARPTTPRAPKRRDARTPVGGHTSFDNTVATRMAGNMAVRQLFHSGTAPSGLANGGSSPLPGHVRSFMEERFGADFGAVRLHAGRDAAELNRAVRGRAFTYGSDIYLGDGRNDFQSAAEKRLLAHELTHVVQQTGKTALRPSGRNDRSISLLPGHAAAELRISRVPPSLQRSPWEEFTNEVTSIGKSAVEGAQAAGAAILSGAGALASGAGPRSMTEGAETADLISNWRHIQVDWNSAPGMIVKAWASQLDPQTVSDVRGHSPAALFNLIDVPDYVREAAGELAKHARADFEPSLRPPITAPPITAPPITAPPTVVPQLPPGLARPPVVLPLPPVLVALLVFIAIMLFPSNTFQTNTEAQELEKTKARAAEDRKKKNEEEKGRCRETIPALRGQIHQVTLQLLNRNAGMYLDQRLGDTPRTREAFGNFFLRNDFFFFLAIVRQTKNAILKVCNPVNNTLATSSGDKLIFTPLHAEEIAAPALTAQLRPIPVEQREGATLFNVCQSRACAENARNPDGCTAVLNEVQGSLLPGGQVADEPAGFPPDLRAHTDAALLHQLEARLPNP